MTTNCVICTKDLSRAPMCFKGEPWCSERCRKVMQGEIEPTPTDWQTMTGTIHRALSSFWNDDGAPRVQYPGPVQRGDVE